MKIKFIVVYVAGIPYQPVNTLVLGKFAYFHIPKIIIIKMVWTALLLCIFMYIYTCKGNI